MSTSYPLPAAGPVEVDTLEVALWRWRTAVADAGRLRDSGEQALRVLLGSSGRASPTARRAVAAGLLALAARDRVLLADLLDQVEAWCHGAPADPAVVRAVEAGARRLGLSAILVQPTHREVPRVAIWPLGLAVLHWPHAERPCEVAIGHELGHVAVWSRPVGAWEEGVGRTLARLTVVDPGRSLGGHLEQAGERLCILLRGLAPAWLGEHLASELHEAVVDAVAWPSTGSLVRYRECLAAWLVRGGARAGCRAEPPLLRLLLLEGVGLAPGRMGLSLFGLAHPGAPGYEVLQRLRLEPGERLAACSRLGAALGEVEDRVAAGEPAARRAVDLLAGWLALVRLLSAEARPCPRGSSRGGSPPPG